jgi:peptide-methionine (R)-S-oxide reductase
MMDRRGFLTLFGGGLAACALAGARLTFAQAGAAAGKVAHSAAEWKKLLTPAQYHILREEGTEAPWTSALLKEHRAGTFACAGCGQKLFPSAYKFDSGTGWPSFYDHLPGTLEMKSDHKLIFERTEYHCSRCGGHHGHVFNDGPKPTGLRYCNNGAALTFIPEKA